MKYDDPASQEGQRSPGRSGWLFKSPLAGVGGRGHIVAAGQLDDTAVSLLFSDSLSVYLL